MKRSGRPTFKDYRTTSDGVMIADVGFKKQLWALDPELDVVWDWASGKWEIWRFPGQKGRKRKRIDHLAHHMMTVQTKDRTFRQLGADVLLKLQKGDPTRYSLKDLVRYFDQMDENIRRSKERAFRNRIESLALETFDYVRGVLKVQVPRTSPISQKDKKYLLNVSPTLPKETTFKVPTSLKIRNAIAGGE